MSARTGGGRRRRDPCGRFRPGRRARRRGRRPRKPARLRGRCIGAGTTGRASVHQRVVERDRAPARRPPAEEPHRARRRHGADPERPHAVRALPAPRAALPAASPGSAGRRRGCRGWSRRPWAGRRRSGSITRTGWTTCGPWPQTTSTPQEASEPRRAASGTDRPPARTRRRRGSRPRRRPPPSARPAPRASARPGRRPSGRTPARSLSGRVEGEQRHAQAVRRGRSRVAAGRRGADRGDARRRERPRRVSLTVPGPASPAWLLAIAHRVEAGCRQQPRRRRRAPRARSGRRRVVRRER